MPGGVTVRPIEQLNGLPGFAEIFFDDVRVPAFNLLGEEGAGWQIAMATAGFRAGTDAKEPGTISAGYPPIGRSIPRAQRGYPRPIGGG
jgi:alkylation response protein AidB-like acyl-CoA dehydrogenase